MSTTQESATAVAVPPAARLSLEVDERELRADLARLSATQWNLQRSFADDGSIREAVIDWRCLALRSVNGDPERTDPGGPGLHGFADTPQLLQAPYMSAVLAALPAELRSARLLALGPGAASWEHCDTKYGPAWGTARIHIPITTTPGASLYLEGQLNKWQPGSVWFADFSRMHRVENTDSVRRVHLVVDSLLSPELYALFPEDYRELMRPTDLLFNAREVPVREVEFGVFRVGFQIPASFLSWEEVDGQFLAPQQLVLAKIDVHEGRLTLFCDGQPLFGLVHTGDGEFRFAGWTDERTLQVSHGPLNSKVTIRSRRGSVTRQLELDANDLMPR